MKKIEKEEWLVIGINILNDGDFSKIVIQNLCDKMEVTKGAFYYYFKNIDNYIEELMIYWEQKYSQDFIKEAERTPNIGQRRINILMKATRAKHRNEQTVRAWSYSNRIVKKYVQAVDHFRFDYFTNLRIQAGENPVEARTAAMFELATLVGIQSLYITLPKDELPNMFQEKVNSTTNSTTVRKRN